MRNTTGDAGSLESLSVFAAQFAHVPLPGLQSGTFVILRIGNGHKFQRSACAGFGSPLVIKAALLGSHRQRCWRLTFSQVRQQLLLRSGYDWR